MENIENVLNELVAKLLQDGVAEFNQDGLNIKTKYNDGCLQIMASMTEPEQDVTKEIVEDFKKFVDSLSDEFFVEIAETFAPGELKDLQEMIDSKNLDTVNKGIDIFKQRTKTVANDKLKSISKDISELQDDLYQLLDIRDSYKHILKTL